MKVYVSRHLPGAALNKLSERYTVEVWPQFMPPSAQDLQENVKGASALLCTVDDRIDAQVMDAAGPTLRVIASYAVGVNNIDLEAARERNIRVTNTPNTNAEATADLAFALLCAVGRRVVEGAQYAKSGQWQTWHPELLLGTELHKSTLGIIGMGSIGLAMIKRARGFSMRVLYVARSRKSRAESLGARRVSLEELLMFSDFVSLHAPLTPETHHLINRESLAQMKAGAVLINTARGAIVDTQALLEALQSGRLGGAGLDVTDPEPLPITHPLYQMPNVVILPHIGSAGRRTREAMAEVAVENIEAVLQGHEPPNPVV